MVDAIGDREGIGRARDAMSEFPTDGMGSDETREHCGLSVHIVLGLGSLKRVNTHR